MTNNIAKKALRNAVITMALLIGLVSHAFSADIKEGAPERYVVKKGDTLWDISGMYLDQPWRWPELWANNTQIENPHLIYPGDVLVLRFVDGKPVLMVERDNKKRMTLTPDAKRIDKTKAIDLLPWELLEPYIEQSWIVAQDTYDIMPKVLGNQAGAVRFADDDVVLTRRFGRAEDQYHIIRHMGIIKDLDGNELGYQINHIASADMLEKNLGTEWLVKVAESKQEVKRGDRLWSAPQLNSDDLALAPVENIRGNIVGSLHPYAMFGKYDVVVIDLGSTDVNPGSVMGIYAQGPNIIDDGDPKYATESSAVKSAFNDGTTVEQPAIKLGDLVVFSTFDKASFAIITNATKSVKKGFIVGKP